MRSRRRNSDARLRELTRRVAGGEHDLIPALALEWRRVGGDRTPALRDLPDVLRDVVAAFTGLEIVSDALNGPADILLLFTNPGDYRELVAEDAVSANIGYVRGVAAGLGATIPALWEQSEVARDGAGAKRLAALAIPSCNSCGRLLDEDLDRHENGSWEADCRACRVGPECSVCHREMTEDEIGDEMPNERVCDECAGIPPEAPVSAARRATRRVLHELRTGGSRATVVVTDPLCTCGHRRSLHRAGTDRCRGTGADLDAEYAIPPEEWCACRRFERSD